LSYSTDVCLTAECTGSAARLLQGIDKTVNPCDNFFDFACGTWRKTNVIPEDKSSLNVFGVLRDEVEVVMKCKFCDLKIPSVSCNYWEKIVRFSHNNDTKPNFILVDFCLKIIFKYFSGIIC